MDAFANSWHDVMMEVDHEHSSLQADRTRPHNNVSTSALFNIRGILCTEKNSASCLSSALPLSLAQVAQNTTALVDTLMVGRLGDDALAGIAIGATMFQFTHLVLAGVIHSVSPIVSQATGAREIDKNRTSRSARISDRCSRCDSLLPCLLECRTDPALDGAGRNTSSR